MDRPSEEHERQIARWLRQGEPRGVSHVLEHYGPRVAGYLRRRFPSLDDHGLHDVLADAVLALADSFDADRGSLAAWLLLLAHQRAVSRLRTQRTAPRWESWDDSMVEPASAAITSLEELVIQERLTQVDEIIGSLSVLEQAVVRADLDAGRCVPAADLAPRLHTTAGSVYAARQRARRKLVARCPWIRQMLGDKKGPSHDETA